MWRLTNTIHIILVGDTDINKNVQIHASNIKIKAFKFPKLLPSFSIQLSRRDLLAAT